MGKSRDFKAREVKTHLHTSTRSYPHALLVKLFVAGFLDRQLVRLGPKLVTTRKRGRKEHDCLQVHPFYHILNIAFDRTRKTVFKIIMFNATHTHTHTRKTFTNYWPRNLHTKTEHCS